MKHETELCLLKIHLLKCVWKVSSGGVGCILFAYVTCSQIHSFNVWLSVQTPFGATRRNSDTSDSTREVGCALVNSARGGRAVARCELLVRFNCVADVPFSSSAGGNYRTSRDKLGGACVNALGFLCVTDCGYNAYKHTFFKSAN